MIWEFDKKERIDYNTQKCFPRLSAPGQASVCQGRKALN
jgi:hypothetical protein